MRVIYYTRHSCVDSLLIETCAAYPCLYRITLTPKLLVIIGYVCSTFRYNNKTYLHVGNRAAIIFLD